MSDDHNSAQSAPYKYKNTAESLSGLGSSMVQNAGSAMRDIGLGMFDQILNNRPQERPPQSPEQQRRLPERKPLINKSKPEHNVFNFNQEQEVRTIRELTEQIRREVKAMKQMEQTIANDIKDIEKLALEQMPEGSVGIYHVRFLEIVLSIMKSLRAKINESHIWMQALTSRRKRRGYKSNSADLGNKYTQSDELKAARVM